MKRMYHIHKLNNNDEMWKVGNEFEVGNEKNNFTKFSFNFESNILIEGVKYPYKNVYDYYEQNGNILGKINLLNEANIFISEYQILVRELGMEEIRRSMFPKLPSRQSCIWLCRKEQINYWKKFINEEVEVFEVEINNNVFKTRNSLIPLPTDSYQKILEKSKLYWNENNMDENEDDEYLYVGKLKIIKKINENVIF